MDNDTYRIDERFRTQVVEDMEGFGRLKETWDGLAAKSFSYVPWLRHDWYKLWLKHFLGKANLFIVVLHDGEGVFAIAPFMISMGKYKGVPEVRKVELIGNVHSPIRSFLFRDWSREERQRAVKGVLDFLQSVGKKWDVLELARIPEENHLVDDVKCAIEQAQLEHRMYVCDANWFLDGIENGFSAYFSTLARAHRKDVKRCRRNLERIGEVRAEVKRDDERLDHYLRLYDSIRKRSWKAPERDKGFLREFMELAAGQGWMRLAFLFVEDNPIAGEKWVVYDGTGWTLDGVFDQEYSKQSPGKVLTLEATREAIDEDKVSIIDYMTGDEEYKKHWVQKRRERKGFDVYNTTVKGRLLAFLMKRVVPVTEKYSLLSSAKVRAVKYLKEKGST